MWHALASGAGPVWAPIMRGQDVAQHWRAMRLLNERYGLVSGSKPFNWSGNPLRPAYETCFALPVHGGVSEFEAIVAALDSTV
jgi:hypothetical protein